MIEAPYRFPVPTITVDGSAVRMAGSTIFVCPTPIAEIASYDDRIFLILAVDQSSAEAAGTNLWCINIAGELLWKAANLNVRCSEGRAERSYGDLRIFDISAPKLDVMTSERSRAILDLKTGQFDNKQPLLDWSSPNAALAQYNALRRHVDSTAFLASDKLRQVRAGLPIVHRQMPAHCRTASAS